MYSCLSLQLYCQKLIRDQDWENIMLSQSIGKQNIVYHFFRGPWAQCLFAFTMISQSSQILGLSCSRFPDLFPRDSGNLALEKERSPWHLTACAFLTSGDKALLSRCLPLGPTVPTHKTHLKAILSRSSYGHLIPFIPSVSRPPQANMIN